MLSEVEAPSICPSTSLRVTSIPTHASEKRYIVGEAPGVERKGLDSYNKSLYISPVLREEARSGGRASAHGGWEKKLHLRFVKNNPALIPSKIPQDPDFIPQIIDAILFIQICIQNLLKDNPPLCHLKESW